MLDFSQAIIININNKRKEGLKNEGLEVDVFWFVGCSVGIVVAGVGVSVGVGVGSP